MTTQGSIFDIIDGAPHFHCQPVEFKNTQIGDRSYELATLRDPAALLDLPDFARAFIDEDRAPYGLELWPSSIALANHLAQHDPGHGRPALELGCGVGLVSLVAAASGWRVSATDYDAAALAFTAYNASANRVELAAIEQLDWRYPEARPPVDRIFAADVLYQLVDHAPILTCLTKWLSDSGKAFIVDPGRGVADRFPQMAEHAGFSVTRLKPGPEGEPGSERNTPGPSLRIWCLSLPS